MAELLLINPRKRVRKAKKAKRKTRGRRRNPVSMRAVTRRAATPVARKNPRRRRRRSAVFSMRRRRRNPSFRMRGIFSGLVPMLQNAAIGAAGAIGVDLAMGQVNRFLPDAVKVVPGRVGAGDAVKAVITVALGKLLSRPTRGMSVTAAQGALTVQAHGIIKQFLPATITGQLAYASPARIVPGSNRIGPNTMAAYQRPGGSSTLLNAYLKPGSASPMLNSARRRESFVR
jgi:hypothetical protein